jgi:hypothetical protein
MGLEAAPNDLISELDQLNPLDGDLLAVQNEHSQLIKRVLQAQFPGNTAPLTFSGTMKVDNYDATDDFTADMGTGDIDRKGRETRLSRETAAAVIWTVAPFSTQAWVAGDLIVAYLGDGIDVQVLPSAAGLFTLPDGTQVATMEATVDGTIKLLSLGVDNWRLLRQ